MKRVAIVLALVAAACSSSPPAASPQASGSASPTEHVQNFCGDLAPAQGILHRATTGSYLPEEVVPQLQQLRDLALADGYPRLAKALGRVAVGMQQGVDVRIAAFDAVLQAQNIASAYRCSWAMA